MSKGWKVVSCWLAMFVLSTFLPTNFFQHRMAKAESIPSFQRLFVDKNDSFDIDIRDVSLVLDKEVVIFKISFYKPWNQQSSKFNLFFLIDTDNNPSTGTNGSNEMRSGSDILIFLGYLKGSFSAVVNSIKPSGETAYLEEIPYYYLPVNEKFAYIALPRLYLKTSTLKFWMGSNNHVKKEYDCYPDEGDKQEMKSFLLPNFTAYSGTYLKKMTLQINNKNAIVSGKTVMMDVAPLIKDGKTFVAFRFIGENLGSDVSFKVDDATKKLDWIAYRMLTKSIFLTIGKKEGLVNGRSIVVDPPPEIMSGRAVVPLRFVSENLSCQVRWYGKTQSILITSMLDAEEKQSSLDTVQSFLISQTKKDIEEQLTYVDLGRLGPTGDKEARELVSEIATRVDISDYHFEEQITVDFNNHNLSIVRFGTRSVLKARDGQISQHNGSVAILQRRGTRWKIITFLPDEFLNMQFLLEEKEKPLTNTHSLLEEKSNQIKSINQKLNKSLGHIYIDKLKAGLDGFFSLVGYVPGIGDTISNTYTFYDMVTQVPDMASDIKLGNYTCAMFGIVQIGWGAIQMCAEYFPGLDHGTDSLAILLDQSVKNARNQWAFLTVKIAIINARITAKKYLYPYHKAGLTVPGDLRFFDIKDWPSLYLTPPETLYIMSDKAYTKQLPIYFAIISCVAIPLTGSKELTEACKVLKAKIDDYYDIALIPILYRNIASGLHSEGTSILGKMTVERRIGFSVSCQRGIQFLKIQLEDGSYTEPLIVENYIFNVIDGIIPSRQGSSLDSLMVKIDENIEDIKFLGTIPPAIKAELGIDLPDLSTSACATFVVSDPSVAELKYVGGTFTLLGKASGRTVIRITYPGSSGVQHRKEVKELRVDIPVIVEDTKILQSKHISFGLYLYNEYTLSEGDPIKEEYRLDFNTKDSDFPGTLKWSGNTFTLNIAETVSDGSYYLTMTGNLYNGFKKLDLLCHIEYQSPAEHTSGNLKGVIDFSFKGLPVTAFDIAKKTFRQQVKGESVREYLKTFKYEYQFEELNSSTGKYFVGTGKYSRTLWSEDSSIGCNGLD